MTKLIGKELGDANRERIRAWLVTHIGGTNRECGKALGLTEYAVGRHVKKLRAEWLDTSSEKDNHEQEAKDQYSWI